MELVFLRSAEADLFEIYDRCGESAHQRIEHSLEFIRSHPEIGVPIKGKIRRKLVIKTPFGVFYQIEGRRIVVHAILDLRKDLTDIFNRL